MKLTRTSCQRYNPGLKLINPAVSLQIAEMKTGFVLVNLTFQLTQKVLVNEATDYGI
jgi:hypothetical protein